MPFESGCHQYRAWIFSTIDTGYPETISLLLSERGASGTLVGWGKVLRSNQSDIHQVNADSESMPTCTCKLCGCRTQHRIVDANLPHGRRAQYSNNGGCPYGFHPEATKFIFSLFVSGIFQATVPLLELIVSACG